MTLARRLFLLCAAAALAACATNATPSDIRQALAPTGVLRIGVYPGSPTSMVGAGADARGLSVELGRALARQMGVRAELVVRPRVAEVVDALKSGDADFTVTNATSARATMVDFTDPLVALELGYLSLPGSRVQALADVDQPGVTIGVTEGSSSLATLTAAYKNARIVTAPTLDAAREMLSKRQIDAYATNKAILNQLADTLPGARILDGRWGLEHLAIAVPKGRGDAAMAYLRGFEQNARDSGLVNAAAERAQLRGLANSP
jgi:polar amino acid transport system substrate-binding protein